MTTSGTSGVGSTEIEEVNPENRIAEEEYDEHDMPVHHPVHPVADPGVEEHVPRLTDVDEAAADRVQRQVVTMFLLVPVMAVLFVLAYYFIPRDATIDFGPLHSSAIHVALGLTLGIGILLIGLASLQWARQLMVNTEVVEARHPSYSPPDAAEEAMNQLTVGIEESGVPRRKILIYSAMGALGILAAPALVLLTDLGPVAGPNYRKRVYASTLWHTGVRLVNDITFAPIRAQDISIGQLVNGAPENLKDLEGTTQFNNERAKAPIVIVRMDPADIKIPDDRRDWQVSGILAYSKICTHVGCPISLWEQQTHHMLCPCHQSTFDLADSGRVIFGPAARALPQLPIKVDDQGYLVARSGFTVPVGPSYFERDSRRDLGESEEYH